MIVTVTPSPAVDRTYDVGALRPGTLHRARRVWVEASGKGVNVSRILDRLGAPTRMIVPAGGGEGRLLAELLPADATELVPVAGATRVNVTLVGGGGEPTKINEPGTALTSEECDRLIAAVARALADHGTSGVTWLACCGSLPGDTAPDLIGRLVERARSAGVPVAVDSSGAALAAAVAAGADLVAPNRAELSELVGASLATPCELGDAARELRARTGGSVLVTLGAEGALLVSPAGDWRAFPPSIVPINSTGAGDALLAAYLTRDGAEPAARLAYAVSIGTSACLAATTAELPDALIDPALVRVRPASECLPPSPHRSTASSSSSPSSSSSSSSGPV